MHASRYRHTLIAGFASPCAGRYRVHGLYHRCARPAVGRRRTCIGCRQPASPRTQRDKKTEWRRRGATRSPAGDVGVRRFAAAWFGITAMAAHLPRVLQEPGQPGGPCCGRAGRPGAGGGALLIWSAAHASHRLRARARSRTRRRRGPDHGRAPARRRSPRSTAPSTADDDGHRHAAPRPFSPLATVCGRGG